MNKALAQDAGKALFWKIGQQGGVNLLYLVRLLILARLLEPEDFGLVAIAMTAVGLFATLTDFGLQPALIQRREPSDRHYDTAWTVGMLRALAIAAGVFVTAPVIADIFAEPRTVSVVRALALLPLLEAAASVRMVDLIRRLRFRALCAAKIAEALTNTVVCIILAPTLGVWALVIGTLAGPTAHVVLSYVVAPYRPRVSFDRSAAGSLISYGRWIFVTGLIGIGAAALLRATISRELGAAELGLYFLAAKLAFWPSEIASEVVGAVSFPVYARVQSNVRHASKAFRAVLISTFLVLTPIVALMVALAPSIVTYILGPQWHGTESLIRVLAVAALVGLLGDVAVPVLKGLGHPHRFALLEGGQSAVLVLGAWFFVDRFGLIGAGYAWLCAVTVTLLLSVSLLRQTLEHPFAGVVRGFGAIGCAAAGGTILALTVQPAVSGWFGLAAASAAAAIGFAAIAWTFNWMFELRLTTALAAAFPQAAPLLAKSK